MIDTRDIPEPIQWSEGMLLGPHHFQQAARRGEALLYYHLGRAVPFYWGVSQLKIDPERLAAGTFRVLELEAVMRDGLVATHPAADGGDLQIDLAPFAGQLQEGPLKIHLVVPKHRSGAALVTGQLARYRTVEGAPVVDENTGEDGVPLPRLRAKLGLSAGDTPSQNFASLPLAEVVHRHEAPELTPFVAPQLAIAPQSALAWGCRDLLQRVRTKAAFVAERLHAPGAELRQATVIELRHSLHCLVASLPASAAILESGVAHPFEIYLAIARLAGNLALLGAGVVPPVFDAYNHDDIRGSFEPLFAFANRMLESVSETHVPVPFTYESGSFRLLIEPAWLRGDLLIGVRARPRQSEREVNAWMDEAEIASSDRVGALTDTRVRGAARRQLTAEEDLEFLPARGIFIYRIAADPNFILPRRVLEIVNPSDRSGERRPLDIVLYVPAEHDRADGDAGFGTGGAGDGDPPANGRR